jgi:hypothetical protein
MFRLLKWLVSFLPSFTISKDLKKYLTRYYVLLKDWEFGNIFIHHFHRSDLDMGLNGLGLLHCHPFSKSVSFILSGGYVEERRNKDGSVSKRIVKPFTFNFISNEDFHRVDLLNESKGAWSIFFTGSRKNRTWGFWDRTSKEYIPWEKVAGAIK